MMSVSPSGCRAGRSRPRAVDPPGLEPEFPARQTGVLPLDDRPAPMDPWGIEPQFPACDAGVFPLDEEPERLHRRREEPSAGGRRQSARAPGLSFLPTADAPPSEVAEVGLEPTDLTRLSTWPLCRFAYSATSSGSSQLHLASG